MLNSTQKPLVAIITATYNEFSKLESWRRYYETIAKEIDLHIIVDDGSDAEYGSLLRKVFPNSVILRNPSNLGQIAAHNLGFKYALDKGAQYIGVLAPDFRLLPGKVRALYEALEVDTTLSGIAPVLIKPGTEDEIESFGGRLDKRRVTLYSYDVGPRWRPDWQGVALVDTLPGGFHLLQRTVLEQIGLQNEQLFMYCDEIDFGWRAQQAELKLGILRSARAWHEHVSEGGRSRSALAPYLVSRNRTLIMNWCGHPRDKWILLAGRLATLVPAMLGYYRREGTIWHACAYALGLWHGVLGVTGRPPPSVWKLVTWRRRSSTSGLHRMRRIS